MSFDYRLDKYYDEAETDLNEEFISQLTTSERYKELTKIAINSNTLIIDSNTNK